jgi:DNA (cytosine-5)-methyltransferase 1
MKEIRVFEAFAGYGSQLMALKQLEKDYPDKIKVTPVGIAEIDKYAIQAYKAVHGEVTNYGDISKINWDEVPDFDLFTYSSPCQDFSNAGLQRGGEEGSGTRSSLLWECRRAILAKKPKYFALGECEGSGQ